MAPEPSDMNTLEMIDEASSHRGRDFTALPPTDGGYQAWSLLASCFIAEALIWGFPLNFGIFEAYYTTQRSLMSHPHATTFIPAIGTTCIGVMYFLSPVMSWACSRYPALRRKFTVMGLVITTAALLGASFCNSPAGLLATQGVLYGLGGALMYFPAIVFVDEWFIRRKGLAYGIMWAGTGASGILTPFAVTALLQQYGSRTTLRAWAIVALLLLTPCVYFLRPRIPLLTSNNDSTTPTSRPRRPRNNNNNNNMSTSSWLLTPAFLTLQSGNILLNLGSFLPATYLPKYATQTLKLPSTTGPALLATYSAAGFAGTILTGLLIDRPRLHITTVTLATALGASAAVLLVWGLGKGETALFIFAALYGCCGGGYTATWGGCSEVIRRNIERRRNAAAASSNTLNPSSAAPRTAIDNQTDGSSETAPANPNVDTSMVIAIFAMGKGIGAVASGPLSASLLSIGQSWGKSATTSSSAYAGNGFGSGYGGIIAFTGVCACLGGVSWVGRRLDFV